MVYVAIGCGGNVRQQYSYINIVNQENYPYLMALHKTILGLDATFDLLLNMNFGTFLLYNLCSSLNNLVLFIRWIKICLDKFQIFSFIFPRSCHWLLRVMQTNVSLRMIVEIVEQWKGLMIFLYSLYSSN